MRIEVEVYKGPLSKDPVTQVGEFVGLVEGMYSGFVKVLLYLHYTLDVERCWEGSNENSYIAYHNLLRQADVYRFLEAREQERAKRVESQITGRNQGGPGTENMETRLRASCGELESVVADLNALKQSGLDQLHDAVRASFADAAMAGDTRRIEAQKILQSAAAAAFNLKVHALHWQAAMLGSYPQKSDVRAAVVGFATLASEFSNQIGSRADALLLQISGRDRRELPLSTQIRDAGTTDFFNLYAWDEAALDLSLGNLLVGSVRPTDATTNERIRIMERLYADQNWSRVNTVFAAGQGETALAFIKDDIGNWNLKSFDSDPSELLAAYNNVVKASLAQAASLAATISSGGGSAGASAAILQLRDLANQFATGQSSSNVGAAGGGIDVQKLHQRTATRLDQLRTSLGQKPTSDQVATALKTAKQILSDHAAVVDVLMEGAAQSGTPTATSAPLATGASITQGLKLPPVPGQ